MSISYEFFYVYGNGDFYSGRGYADASVGYYNGLAQYNFNETGSSGYYYIYNVQNLGSELSYEGFVEVLGYYDAETATLATHLYDYYGTYGRGVGFAGLGSEYGSAYNASFSNGEIGFGGGYFEADLTPPIGPVRVTPETPNNNGSGFIESLDTDPNDGWIESFNEDNGILESLTRTFANQLVIEFEDDPLIDDPQISEEQYTISLLDAATTGLGFTQNTYIVNEGDGSAIIPLSSSSTLTTATFIIRDDDWNDNFAAAASLNEIAEANGSGSNPTFISSDSTTLEATREPGEPDPGFGDAVASIWWSWTAPYSGRVQVTTETNGRFDTLLGVYTGASVSSLSEVVSNDDDPEESGDRDSRVTFNAVAGTTYQLEVDGNRAAGDVTLNLEVLEFTVSSEGASSNLPISDLSTVRSDILVNSGLFDIVEDVNVSLDITHSWDEDLEVFLISPSGTRVELFADLGGNGDNFTLTTFDDEVTTDIVSGAAPFTGSFRPTGSLSNFDFQNLNGIWGLEITDDTGGDVGLLNSWSLTFATFF